LLPGIVMYGWLRNFMCKELLLDSPQTYCMQVERTYKPHRFGGENLLGAWRPNAHRTRDSCTKNGRKCWPEPHPPIATRREGSTAVRRVRLSGKVKASIDRNR